MKKILPFLFAMLVMPVWAGDAAPVSEQKAPVELKDTANGQTARISILTESLSASTLPLKSSGASPLDAPASSALSCPVGCAVFACPPPSGMVKCCNTKTYKAC